MANSINRRTWIKFSAYLAGGLTFLNGPLNQLIAKPLNPFSSWRSLTDEEVARSAPPELKARLFANENPFGPSAKAKKAIQDSLNKSYQYPFMHLDELTQKIASSENISPEHILLGAGSTPLLLAAAMYYGQQGGNIITGDPSYDDLPSHAEYFGAKLVKVPLTRANASYFPIIDK